MNDPYEKNVISLLDTNIFLSHEVYSLYRDYLSISNGNGKGLNDIIDIPMRSLNGAVESMKNRVDIMGQLYSVKTTEGVNFQVAKKISDINSNIDTKKSTFLYHYIHPSTNKTSRDYGSVITSQLSELSDLLSNAKNYSNNLVETPNSKVYMLLNELASDVIHQLFPDMNSGVYEGNTDNDFITLAMFESLYQKKSVNVITNDGAIMKSLGVMTNILESFNIMGTNDTLKKFNSENIKGFNLINDKLTYLNVAKCGRDFMRELSGSYSEKTQFNVKIGTLSRISKSIFSRLESALDKSDK